MVNSYSNPGLEVTLGKSVVGINWIGLGVYSYSLAKRLLSDERIASWIRTHAKNFLGVNIMFVLSFLLVSVVAMNMYWDRSVLYTNISYTGDNNTAVIEPNCASVDADKLVCQVYYGSKILFSALCTLWNLLVTGVCVSVCRTHTIGIRRFQRELINDAKLYEEFCKIQAMLKDEQDGAQDTEDSWEKPDQGEDNSGLVIDIEEDSADPDIERDPPKDGLGSVRNSRLLRAFTQIRRQGRQSKERLSTSVSFSDTRINSESGHHPLEAREHTMPQHLEEEAANQTPISMEPVDAHFGVDVPSLGDVELRHISQSGTESGSAAANQSWAERSAHLSVVSMLNGESTLPIMSNEALYYTFYQLSGRLNLTSRLLQRWVATWVAFALIWCCLLLFYWMVDSFMLIGIMQVVGCLLGLVLLVTVYAEANFEGERLSSFVMPFDERMPFMIHIHNMKLALKVYNMPVTHTAIATLLAGVIVTFATRVILNAMDL